MDIDLNTNENKDKKMNMNAGADPDKGADSTNSELSDARDGLKRLQDILRGYGSVLIAYSGGVDSTFLCKTAFETLGANAVAVTARSSTYPVRELKESRDFAKMIGIRHLEIDSEELDIPGFAQNDRNRCFYCKEELFTKLLTLSEELHMQAVLEGSNLDDNGDYRPGLRAAEALGIKSPMREAGLTKQMIRLLSQDYGLPTWNKPSFACLSSRFPYGEPITHDKLQQVEKAEQFLFDKGFSQVRVRHHGQVARIELLPAELPRLLDPAVAEEISRFFRNLGFQYTAADISGYRTGSMNEVL
jgi:uncharacterized protein